MDVHEELERLRRWMIGRGWKPLPHQEATWAAQLAGESGLVCVPTGMGKTYAAYFGALAQQLADPGRGLRMIWLTPLRAMARDIEAALRAPIEELQLGVEVASRTGDTPASARRKLQRELPNVLLTTPESLSLLLSYADAKKRFGKLTLVVVDEWHELAGSKRGTQTELALARLRRWNPGMRTWALSATVGNLEELACAATGSDAPTIVGSDRRKETVIRTLQRSDGVVPPWFGHLGSVMFDAVASELDVERSTLLFANTRSQAERWHGALVERLPKWADRIAVHHGSIDRDERERIEAGLNDGSLSIVVATSSLDLGVDFAPVERVFQIGSARSVARLLQRAGRSGHRPEARSEVILVPTHAMQSLEAAAMRRAVRNGHVEPRHPLESPVDVLVQHLVTCALGGGFDPDELFDEVRTAYGYRRLKRSTFDWVLALVEHGGKSLRSYPNYHRVRCIDDRYVMPDKKLARMHRASIGTITGNTQVRVRFTNGKALGQVDEQFVARLERGDRFVFAGRTLEVVLASVGEVRVRLASKSTTQAPRWMGNRMTWSSTVAAQTRALLDEAREALEADPEAPLGAIEPELGYIARVLRLQHRSASLPRRDRVLCEVTKSRSGTHLFLFPFAGHLAHEGLAALLAYRLSRRDAATFAMSVNDYGLELHSPSGFDFASTLDAELFDSATLDDDILAAVNAAELTRRQFREVARVSGLVFEGWPSNRKTARQLQTSAGLIHDVFARWEPDNLLLAQARGEVLAQQFDRDRLAAGLEELRAGLDVHVGGRFTPLSFPLVVDRVAARVSSETALQRLERMKQRWFEVAEASS